ncbi:MAG: hypothetical protein DRH10_08615, partial [Deltaproteobacteria bacterium]
DASGSADIIIQQAGADELGATSLVSPLYVTAGDFNGDNKLDLLVGQPSVIQTTSQSATPDPSTILNQQERGHVYLFYSLVDENGALVKLSEADLVMEGEGEFDKLGTLPNGPCIDLDGDRIDDLIMGASEADGFIGSVKADAGRLYFIYGINRVVAMPESGYDVVANRSFTGSGDFLVDTGTGRPDVFTDLDLNKDGVLDSCRFVLPLGQSEHWYRFTTLGDGQPGNYIRLSPVAVPSQTYRLAGYDGILTGGGVDLSGETLLINNDRTGIMEFDLARLLPFMENPEYLAGVILYLSSLTGANVTLPDHIANLTPVTLAGRVRLFFTVNANEGYELWLSDGTAFGTEKVSDLPGTPANLTAALDKLVFTVDTDSGNQLWTSDGTEQGTESVADLDYSASQLTGVGNSYLFFVMHDPAGDELWMSDGTGAGTMQVTQGRDPDANPVNLTNVSQLCAVGGTLFFVADFESTATLWKTTDGDVSNTVTVIEDSAVFTPSEMTSATLGGTDYLFFSASDGKGEVLWVINDSGDASILKGSSGQRLSNPSNFTVMGNTLYFTADDGTSGVELWKSDGTSTGTTLAADINSGANSSTPSNLIVLDTTLFFTADDGTNGVELWKYDGSDASLVMDINTGPAGSNPSDLMVLNGLLLFTASTGANGVELWKTDGTTASIVLDIQPGPGSSNPSHFTEFQGNLYFIADDGIRGAELWTTDGTNISLVRDINPSGSAFDPTSPGEFVISNGMLFFAADDGTNGVELWRLGTGKAKAIITPPGDNNDILIVATNAGDEYEGVRIFFVNDPTITDGSASVNYDANAKLLMINIESGATNANAVLDAVNYLLTQGMYTTVQEGTHSGQDWTLTTPNPIVIDTTSISFSEETGSI